MWVAPDSTSHSYFTLPGGFTNPGPDFYNVGNMTGYQPVYFSTIEHSTSGTLTAHTDLIAYELINGGQIQQRTVRYHESPYAAVNFGSLLAFDVQIDFIITDTPNTFFINVTDTNGAGGRFTLTWGLWFRPTVSCCNTIKLTDPSNVCIGPQINPSVLSNSSNSFGDMPAGLYKANYVGGVWNNSGGFHYWSIDQARDGDLTNGVVATSDTFSTPNLPLDGAHWIWFVYNSDSGQTVAYLDTSPSMADTASPCNLELFSRCASTPVLNHTGGEIFVRFHDGNLPDNIIGPNCGPGFTLTRFELGQGTITIDSASAQWISNYQIQCIFTLRNNSSWDIPGSTVLASLVDNGTTVRNPSASQYLTIDAFSTAELTFTFDATSDFIEPITLQFSYSGNTATAGINLAMGFSPSLVGMVDLGFACYGVHLYGLKLSVNNFGNLTPRSQEFCVTDSQGFLVADISCNPAHGGVSVCVTEYLAGSPSLIGFFWVLVYPTGTSTAVTFTVTPKDGGTGESLPPSTFTVTIPST